MRMKFGLLFAFQNPPDLGIPSQDPYQDMLRCLPAAEEMGYSSAFCVSHHVQPDGLCPSPMVAMAGAAAVTERMRIGTGILLVPLYAPVKLAEDVAVLDNLSNGRFVLGVAPGYVAEEFAAHGVRREERHGRFEEALDLMQMAWSEERFSFSGRYYSVQPETEVTPKPVQRPHPPIWYGVSGPKSLRRAVRRRATLVCSPRHGLAELKQHYEIYENEAASEGFEIPERPLMREVFVAETRERAEEIAAPAVNYLFRELYGAKSAAGERVLRTDSGERVTVKEMVDFEHFKSRYIIGEPEYVRGEVERYERELGTTELICWMHLPGLPGDVVMRSVELFAREVIPAFAKAQAV
jgi:alkanesulfonate monooxygenase SsuD/methylene tetrahydromethanopterin reductase-like flavin-dependent oxidoreductase (luciferase family)